ncbi:hypothetical protein EVG20_g1353 [Dentipellis fragilis]|uniref:RlpA-like protein double-psi beta-barrel domain-containing protein n=1 Tax=Dentipellis fragilis TaxID=205917 RepID=A0A4Y9Z9Y3_9AGAM|nr:hypothetical protein EVG20_g1353 [Dentipellis fragilis]
MHFTSTLTSCFFAALALAPFISAQSDGHVVPGRHHRGLSRRASDDVQVYSRDDNARFTFYDVGEGACGGHSKDSDWVVALNANEYANGAHCWKPITLYYGGKSAKATIVDECPDCPKGALDLSRGLFDYFASEDKGVIYGSWNFS